jgi:glyoxylase-like metal-dependent hydrolase (beta-lactamase superfamily II)
VELGPHLRRIGNDIIAAYLVVTDEGITVVDAGLPGHWSDLQRELKVLGKTTADIRGVILTHGDSDHLGFAERLRREHGVPVYVGAADAARARGTEKPPKTTFGKSRPLPVLGFFGYALRKGGFRTRYLGGARAVTDGETLDLPGAPQIIGMPGHSPGSIAVYVPVADAVLVGDALTTRHVLTGVVGPQPAPFTDEPELALQSLDNIAGLDAHWLLPGHGGPWHGDLRDAVAAVRSA